MGVSPQGQTPVLRSQSMSYATGCHTVFHHRYHIVWVTKYRYKVLEGTLRERNEPSSDRRPGNWACRSSQAFCPESMSTCSSRYHPISRSATLCAGSKAVPRTECRWSSQSFANVTGDATSGREATSARPAATSRMKRYFSISGIMNLPASAGSYSVSLYLVQNLRLQTKLILRLLGSQ